MKERGLLLLNGLRAKSKSGEKTQTRRLVRLPKYVTEFGENKAEATWFEAKKPDSYGASDFAFYDRAWPIETYPTLATAQYEIGDHLYLQEPYQILRTWYKSKMVEGRYVNADQTQIDDPFGPDGTRIRLTDAEWKLYSKRKWPHRVTPSRFMYKSLARTWFEVTDVRVERLQDISEADATAEGIICPEWYSGEFRILWDSINKKRGYGWDTNPWVWVVEFRRIDK